MATMAIMGDIIIIIKDIIKHVDKKIMEIMKEYKKLK